MDTLVVYHEKQRLKASIASHAESTNTAVNVTEHVVMILQRHICVLIIATIPFFALACDVNEPALEEDSHGQSTNGNKLKVPGTDIDDQQPVISIYDHPSGTAAFGEDAEDWPVVHVAIWPDGRTIWRQFTEDGEGRYMEGAIPRQQVQDFLHVVQERGIFDDGSEDHFGPDSLIRTIVIFGDEGQRVALRSWHEFFESQGLAVTQQGVVAEGDREWSESYRRFREHWSVMRDRLNHLTPEEGDPIEVQFQLHD